MSPLQLNIPLAQISAYVTSPIVGDWWGDCRDVFERDVVLKSRTERL